MPTSAESPASSLLPRRKITEVIAQHHAASLDVCKAGQFVALHFATTRGVVLVTVAASEFQAKCRGPRDYNGNPLEPLTALPPVGEGEEVPPPDFALPEPSTRTRALAPEKAARYLAAVSDYRHGRYPSLSAAARAHGLDSGAVHAWARRRTPALTDGLRAPLRKPGGKLL